MADERRINIDINNERLAVILLFILTFAFLGYTAPDVIAQHRPADSYIQVHSFHAEDVQQGTTHIVVMNKTIGISTSGEQITELHRIDGDKTIQVDSSRRPEYYEKGNTVVRERRYIGTDVRPGVYEYHVHIRMRVTDDSFRTFTFESAPFNVTNAKTTEEQKATERFK